MARLSSPPPGLLQWGPTLLAKALELPSGCSHPRADPPPGRVRAPGPRSLEAAPLWFVCHSCTTAAPRRGRAGAQHPVPPGPRGRTARLQSGSWQGPGPRRPQGRSEVWLFYSELGISRSALRVSLPVRRGWLVISVILECAWPLPLFNMKMSVSPREGPRGRHRPPLALGKPLSGGRSPVMASSLHRRRGWAWSVAACSFPLPPPAFSPPAGRDGGPLPRGAVHEASELSGLACASG